MPRRPIIYTHLFPYHIIARSNNREWFYVPIEEMWKIFVTHLNEASERFEFELHAFVLMSNHYHLIATATQPKHPLGEIMCWLQTSVSKTINKNTGRINHVFGGPYKASLIETEIHYAQVFKYIAQNPIRANIVGKVENYPFSFLFNNLSYPPRITLPNSGIDYWIPKELTELFEWLNHSTEKDWNHAVQMGLRRSVFRTLSPSSRRKITDF